MGALKSGCERAREWVSLDLDGELSELEHALLHAHLECCDTCAAFARDVRSLTVLLRAAPAELPIPVALTAPRRQRSGVRVLQVVAAAAAVAVAVGLGTIAGSLTSSSPSAASAAAAIAATQQPYLEQRLLALDRLRSQREGGET